MEIRHIPGKKTPADSLSRQLISDALVRKESVKDANAEYVTRLRVAENATDEQIQSALHQLFSQSVQSHQGKFKNQDNQDPQGHSILTELPQGGIHSVHDESSPQGTNSSILAPTEISKIQLDNSLKNSLHTALQSESPYSEILQDLSGGTRQIVKNNLIFKRMNGMLVVHDQNQDAKLDFWRIVVPEMNEIKIRIVQELHSTPYSAHPGIQRTIASVRRSFWWKGMLGGVSAVR